VKAKLKFLPWILLAASLAFNVFFAAGYVRAKGRMQRVRTFRGRAEMLAKRLQLDERQMQVFQELLAEVEQLRKDRAPQREAFLAEIIKDRPDEKLLEDFVAGQSASKHRLTRLGLMRRFMGLLRPQQREKFAEMVKKRSSSSG
jgi:hypothetical protein